jgi:uncharacterized protein (TIRG00374 family)
MKRMTTRTHFPDAVLQVGRYLIPLIFLGLAFHLLVPQLASLENSFKVIQQMAFWAVGLALIAQVFSYLGSGYMLKAIVRLSGDTLSTLTGTLIVLAAASLGMVVGGMVGIAAATFRWIQKEGVKSEAAGLASTIPGFFNISALVLVSLAGLIHLLLVHQLTRLQALGFTLILLLLGTLTGMLVWGFRHRQSLIQLAHRLGARWAGLRHGHYHPERTEQWFTELFRAWDLLINGGWRGPALGAALNVFFDMLTLYFLFVAAGNPVSPGILLTGYGLPLILGRMAFFIPGGVGIIEGTMVAIYNSLGVPAPVTVVVVIAYRILSFWLPLLLGFPLIWVLGARNRK